MVNDLTRINLRVTKKFYISEKEILKQASIRVQRYWHTKFTKKRLDEIQKRAKDKPHLLQLIIFDEAHYSATSQTDETKGETPYSMLVNYINSEDYPNIIVLFVSATPWTLMTTGSKLRKTEVLLTENGNLQPLERGLTAKKANRKVLLHEITWNHGYEGDFRKGKKMKLQVKIDFVLCKTILCTNILITGTLA